MRAVPMENVEPMMLALGGAGQNPTEATAMDVLGALADMGWQLHREIREVSPAAEPYQPKHMRPPGWAACHGAPA